MALDTTTPVMIIRGVQCVLLLITLSLIASGAGYRPKCTDRNVKSVGGGGVPGGGLDFDLKFVGRVEIKSADAPLVGNIPIGDWNKGGVKELGAQYFCFVMCLLLFLISIPVLIFSLPIPIPEVPKFGFAVFIYSAIGAVLMLLIFCLQCWLASAPFQGKIQGYKCSPIVGGWVASAIFAFFCTGLYVADAALSFMQLRKPKKETAGPPGPFVHGTPPPPPGPQPQPEHVPPPGHPPQAGPSYANRPAHGDTPQQAPGYNPQQAPGQNPKQAPGYNPQPAPGYNPQQAPGQNPQQAPGYNPQQPHGYNPQQAPKQNPHQGPSYNPQRAPGQNPHQAHGYNPQQAPGTPQK